MKLIKALGKDPHVKLLVLLPMEKFFDFDPSKYLFLEKLTGIPILTKKKSTIMVLIKK